MNQNNSDLIRVLEKYNFDIETEDISCDGWCIDEDYYSIMAQYICRKIMSITNSDEGLSFSGIYDEEEDIDKDGNVIDVWENEDFIILHQYIIDNIFCFVSNPFVNVRSMNKEEMLELANNK